MVSTEKSQGFPNGRSPQGGFTLLEVLIAITLLAILMAALYATFFTANRAASAGTDVLQRTQELRAALDLLRREVEASIPQDRSSNTFEIKDRDVFGQKTSRFEFSTFVSPGPGAAHLEYYVIERKDHKLDLMKSYRPAYAPPEAARSAVVIEDVVSFDIQGSNGRNWQTTWSENRPPSEVKISITANLEGRTLTLSETVMPKVNNRI
jgi:general secretion pathway protein J